MRSLKFLSFILLFISSACSNDSDLIAGMKSGMITRGEFRQWLKSRDIDPAGVLSEPADAEKYLRQMAVEKLAVEAAVAAKFDETPFYRNVNRTLYNNYISNYYKSGIKKNIKFNERAVEIGVIHLYCQMPVTGSADNSVFNDKLSLAWHIIQQHAAGVDFDLLRKKFSEEKNNDTEQSSRVIPVSILDRAIFGKIKYLRDGECVSEPVVMKDRILVVKTLKWIDLNSENAQKLISSDELYNRLIDTLAQDEIDYITSEKSGSFKIVSNIDKARFDSRGELLFSIDGESFTTGDLLTLLDLFVFLRGEAGSGKIPDNSKRETTANVFNEYLLAAIALQNGAGNDGKFLEKWEPVRKSALAGAYKYHETVLKDRLTSHAGATEKSVQEFSRRVLSQKTNWENGLLELSGFKIYKDKLH